jgi:ribonuclease HI
MDAVIHIDGAARGNPGPAAYGFVIAPVGQPTIEESGYLGRTTNNVAEYTALVNALERALKLGLRRLTVFSDSELLVKQMNKEYKVKSADLRQLYRKASALCDRFETVLIRHVPRSQNAAADKLCNVALDHIGRSDGKFNNLVERRSPEPEHEALEAVDAEVINCLEVALRSWAAGDPGNPSAKELWQRLKEILQSYGTLPQRPGATK